MGLRWRSQRWDLDVAAFENLLTNLIDFDFATFTNINVGRARTRGAEGELSYHTGRSRSRVAVTYLDTEDLASGLPLLRRPRWSTALEVTFRPGQWTTNVLLLEVGSRPDIDPVTFERTTNPGYTRLDVAARWSGWGAVEPHARIENATDEQYETALGFPASGRRFVAGLALTR
jgi:outer membrane cobalamin receptor